MNTHAIPFAAKLLGYSGVLPFAVLAMVHLYGEQQTEAAALKGFLAYAAVILSFLGGIRWGVATQGERFHGAAPFLSVVPSLWAFGCLLWPDPELAVWGFLAGFAILGTADRWFPAPGGAAWMTVLRSRLTSAVIACHGILIASMTVA
jgi:hypothetical protein